MIDYKKPTIKLQFPYWGPFVMETKIEPEFIDILLEKGNESRAKNLDHRKELAGMIDKEYYYEDYEEWFIPKFTPYIDAYTEGFRTIWMPQQKPIKEWHLPSLWINYQKANEYNPPHKHAADLSFVTYLQVPNKLKKEFERRKGVYNNSGPGAINLDFAFDLPFSISIFSKFPEVGDMFIFPAWLIHYVHAFKSDVERISVSGNIEVKYDKV